MTDFKKLDIEDGELESFLEKVFKVYKVDFRQYGKAHLKRRIRHRMTFAKYENMIQLKEDVLQNQTAFDKLFGDLSINVTELFRDPQFYESLQQFLKQMPSSKPIRIWVSACSTGEEAFSMLMMLEHFKIPYESIIASDFNPQIVERASTGRMESIYMKEYLKNMAATHFDIDFYQFFDFKQDYYQLKSRYLDKIIFEVHNLMDEPKFELFDVILCRNVLIYFEKELQDKVVGLLTQQLSRGGLLCLGAKESLRFMSYYQEYLTIHQNHKIYQKK